MEKIEVMVPLVIPMNVRSLFWREIKVQGLKFFPSNWVQVKGRFPKYYGRLKEYLKANQLLKIDPIIPYEHAPKTQNPSVGRPSRKKPFPLDDRYSVRVLARANGICTIVLENHLRGKVTAERVKKEFHEMSNAGRRLAVSFLVELKGHLKKQIPDPDLERSINGISFGEIFRFYFYSGEFTPERCALFREVCGVKENFPQNMTSTLFNLKKDELCLLVSGVRRPIHLVNRVREGLALALGIRSFLDKYRTNVYYSYATEEDYLYLVHFLNPFIFLGNINMTRFLPGSIIKWFRRLAESLRIEHDFVSLMKKFVNGKIGTNLTQIQLLMALKGRPIEKVNLAVEKLSPSTVALSLRKLSST